MLWEILKAGRTNNSDDLFTRLAARRVSVSKRGYIVLPHGTGAFNATAKGNNIIWEYNGERVQGNTCSFNVLRDNGTIRLAFDEALERLEIKNNNALKADLSDLGGKITSTLNLYNCQNITGDLADLGGKITSYLNLYNCKNITGDLADLGGKITNTLSLYNCTKITGDLADLGGKITSTLSLCNCQNITGGLADLGGKITSTLNLYNCQNITGDLVDLGGKITSYLNLYNCKNITGDLADLGGKITSYLILDNCQNISGVYSGNVYPTGINLSYTGVSAEEMDQNLINLNENTSKKGTFTANGMSRTAASDDAIAGLISKGWTVTGLTKV